MPVPSNRPWLPEVLVGRLHSIPTRIIGAFTALILLQAGVAVAVWLAENRVDTATAADVTAEASAGRMAVIRTTLDTVQWRLANYVRTRAEVDRALVDSALSELTAAVEQFGAIGEAPAQLRASVTEVRKALNAVMTAARTKHESSVVLMQAAAEPENALSALANAVTQSPSRAAVEAATSIIASAVHPLVFAQRYALGEDAVSGQVVRTSSAKVTEGLRAMLQQGEGVTPRVRRLAGTLATSLEALDPAVETLGDAIATHSVTLVQLDSAFRQTQSLIMQKQQQLTAERQLRREQTVSARRSVRTTVLGAAAASGLLGVGLALLVGLSITRPIGRLAGAMRRIASGSLELEVPDRGRRDEIGAMAGAVEVFKDNMIRTVQLTAELGLLNEELEQRVQRRTSELRETQMKLVGAARLAGMAEIAANVLHNVGNVLNSVNISAGLLGERLRTSSIKGLARAVGLMDEHVDDLGDYLTRDAKGKLMPGYLRKLSQALEVEHDAMAGELGTLGRSVEHIKQVVAAQQSYASAPRVVESLKLRELVDEALRMDAGAQTGLDVNVLQDLAELPALVLDRHRLLQILVNLISNARHATSGIAEPPRITLGAALLEGRALRITVADNGSGIAPENLTRIFAHGFTTRKSGNGFGLHSCVIAAQEMGGSLTAQSDGAGLGSTFTLEIPLTPEAPAMNGAQNEPASAPCRIAAA
jgi:signal transduction histidine kinase